MIIYRNSEDSRLLGKMYFDAPHWDETASSDSIRFTVKKYPFDLKQAGIYAEIIRIFGNNSDISMTDIDEAAAFAEKFVNEGRADLKGTSCIAFQDKRIVQISVRWDANAANTYNLCLLFEKYSAALTEATKNGSAEKVPIGELPENTMIWLPYPEIDDEDGMVVVGTAQHAMILPSDITVNPVMADSRMIKNIVSGNRPGTVTVARKDLKDTGSLKNADLFEDERYLMPGSLCYVDKRCCVQARGTIKTEEKAAEIRDAVLNYKGTRAIAVVGSNCGPDPRLLTDNKLSQRAECCGSDASFISETKDKLLIMLFAKKTSNARKKHRGRMARRHIILKLLCRRRRNRRSGGKYKSRYIGC